MLTTKQLYPNPNKSQNNTNEKLIPTKIRTKIDCRNAKCGNWRIIFPFIPVSLWNKKYEMRKLRALCAIAALLRLLISNFLLPALPLYIFSIWNCIHNLQCCCYRIDYGNRVNIHSMCYVCLMCYNIIVLTVV